MGALRGTKARGCVVTAEPDDVKAIEQHFPLRGQRPDAVVCESDFVASQLQHTLDKVGLSVPADILLAGFDDVRIAAAMTPHLTTVHQPCEDIARMAYQTLKERLREPATPNRHILLNAPLVVRDSTKRP